MILLVKGEIESTSAEARLDAALDENRELQRGLDKCERGLIFAM